MVGWGGGGGEKLGIKLKLSFSWGLGLAELGNNKLNNTIFLGFDSIEINLVLFIDYMLQITYLRLFSTDYT